MLMRPNFRVSVKRWLEEQLETDENSYEWKVISTLVLGPIEFHAELRVVVHGSCSLHTHIK